MSEFRASRQITLKKDQAIKGRVGVHKTTDNRVVIDLYDANNTRFAYIVLSETERAQLESDLDEAAPAQTPPPPPPPPSKKRRYGTAITSTDLADPARAKFVKDNFDSLTPRWEGKWKPMAG